MLTSRWMVSTSRWMVLLIRLRVTMWEFLTLVRLMVMCLSPSWLRNFSTIKSVLPLQHKEVQI